MGKVATNTRLHGKYNDCDIYIKNMFGNEYAIEFTIQINGFDDVTYIDIDDMVLAICTITRVLANYNICSQTVHDILFHLMFDITM